MLSELHSLSTVQLVRLKNSHVYVILVQCMCFHTRRTFSLVLLTSIGIPV